MSEKIATVYSFVHSCIHSAAAQALPAPEDVPLNQHLAGDILIVTPTTTTGEVAAASKNKTILMYFGTPEMFAAEKEALRTVALENKASLLVIYADPLQVRSSSKDIASLTQSPAVYPTHIFVGFPYQIILLVQGLMTAKEIETVLATAHAWQDPGNRSKLKVSP